MIEQAWLTPAELCKRYGDRIKVKTLANWRSMTGTGPTFIRMGGRILYPLQLVQEWEARNTYASTRQYTGSAA